MRYIAIVALRRLACLSSAIALVVSPSLSMNSMAQQAEMVPTATYLQTAAVTDLFEVEAGKVALEKTENPEVMTFAQQMTEDHGQSSDKLKQAAQSAEPNAPLPDTLDTEHAQKLEELRSASGAEFDKLYVEMQLAGHQDALELHRSYSQSGENEEIKEAAKEIVPVVEQHLAEIQQIANNLN